MGWSGFVVGALLVLASSYVIWKILRTALGGGSCDCCEGCKSKSEKACSSCKSKKS